MLPMPMGEGAEFVVGQCGRRHPSDERVRIFSEVYALAKYGCCFIFQKDSKNCIPDMKTALCQISILWFRAWKYESFSRKGGCQNIFF